jgi:hypothetical protein
MTHFHVMLVLITPTYYALFNDCLSTIKPCGVWEHFHLFATKLLQANGAIRLQVQQQTARCAHWCVANYRNR